LTAVPERGPAQPIRILIVEDHAVVRESLHVMLDMEPGVLVVGEAADGEDAIALVQQLHPDLVLMDVRMEGMDGVEATRRLHDLAPEVAVLILTGFGEDEILLRAVEAGAHGFLVKDASATEVVEAIRRVAGGESLVTPALLRHLLAAFSERQQAGQEAAVDLTAREMQVLKALGRGLSNEAISRELVISQRTVKTHLSRIFGKLGVSGRAQAMLYAIRRGLVELEDTA
jgi:DNA-binding NarL/FixJ family response regulator